MRVALGDNASDLFIKAEIDPLFPGQTTPFKTVYKQFPTSGSTLDVLGQIRKGDVPDPIPYVNVLIYNRRGTILNPEATNEFDFHTEFYVADRSVAGNDFIGHTILKVLILMKLM